MRARIVNLAEEEIGRFGFRKFTIDSIAGELGISKKTIYKHFTSKQEIISAVINNYIETEKATTLEALEKARAWFDKFRVVISLYSEYKVPLRLLAELQRFFPEEWLKVQQLREFKKEQVYRLLEEGLKAGEINPEFHFDVIVAVMGRALDNLLDIDFLTRHEMTTNQVIEQVRDIFLYGLLKRCEGGLVR